VERPPPTICDRRAGEIRDNGEVRPRFAVPLFCVAVATAVLGGSALPGPAAGRAASDAVGARTLTIRVVSVVVATRPHDRPPKGASKGDRIEFEDRLLNAGAQFGKKANARVGHDAGVMTFTSATTATLSGSAALPGGTIRFNGKLTPTGSGGIRVPVTGGTGKYAHATGTLIVGPGAKRALNTYELTFAPAASGPVA